MYFYFLDAQSYSNESRVKFASYLSGIGFGEISNTNGNSEK